MRWLIADRGESAWCFTRGQPAADRLRPTLRKRCRAVACRRSP